MLLINPFRIWKTTSSSGTSSVSSTFHYVQRHIWTWPLLLALVLGMAGYFVLWTVESAIRGQLHSQLQTILDADVKALDIWLTNEKQVLSVTANSRALIDLVEQLKRSQTPQENALVQEDILSLLHPLISGLGYRDFELLDGERIILSSSEPRLVGTLSTDPQEIYFQDSWAGTTLVSLPYLWQPGLKDEQGRVMPAVPSMVVAGPVIDRTGHQSAVLVLRVNPAETLSTILRVARFGDTGETYAFDRQGLLLSESRFDDHLRQIGLLPDSTDQKSILNVSIVDPGVNLVKGETTLIRRKDQPMTLMAADAIQGNSGVNVSGYRDYRGVPVIGAWTWLDGYNFGIATEVDVEEAFQPLYILRRASWVLFGMLCITSIALLAYTIVIQRMGDAYQQVASKARRLGQYTLGKKIGEGGMGTVYQAQHAFLQRPTAVKLLNPSISTPESVRRFEREVKMTSQLTHPNTIAVYDFGRTSDGVFYYAMEFLEGLTLDELVNQYGPINERRVHHFLLQIAGSLAEAHLSGIVHRDIKPQNIMLTQRGGVTDFVKVLDFGLVKIIDHQKQTSMTSLNAMTGTPLFMSPEAVNNPEAVCAASDVYSLGAVAYYLLTGTHVFPGANAIEICMKHVREEPESPSTRLGREVNQELQDLVMACLQKSIASRPQSALQLRERLEALSIRATWTRTMSETWWKSHSTGETVPSVLDISDSGVHEVAMKYDDGRVFSGFE